MESCEIVVPARVMQPVQVLDDAGIRWCSDQQGRDPEFPFYAPFVIPEGTRYVEVLTHAGMRWEPRLDTEPVVVEMTVHEETFVFHQAIVLYRRKRYWLYGAISLADTVTLPLLGVSIRVVPGNL